MYCPVREDQRRRLTVEDVWDAGRQAELSRRPLEWVHDFGAAWPDRVCLGAALWRSQRLGPASGAGARRQELAAYHRVPRGSPTGLISHSAEFGPRQWLHDAHETTAAALLGRGAERRLRTWREPRGREGQGSNWPLGAPPCVRGLVGAAPCCRQYGARERHGGGGQTKGRGGGGLQRAEGRCAMQGGAPWEDRMFIISYKKMLNGSIVVYTLLK